MSIDKQMRLQLATEAEFPRLAEIELAAARLFPAGRVPDLDDTVPAAQLQQGLEDGLLWVVRAQNIAVGFTLSTVHEKYLHLLEVAVHPDWGQRGIGRQLVGHVIEQAQQRKLPGVTLTTFRDLKFNGPFYRSLGFVEIPEGQQSTAIAGLVAAEQAAGMVQRIGMLCLGASAPA